MARARNIKPSFFTNDELAEIPAIGRLLFIALWTLADRDGRLEDRPKRIKAEALPYDDADVDGLLDELQKRGFILRYQAGEARYIQVLAFTKHQNPHVKEAKSTIPAPQTPGQKPEQNDSAPDEHRASTVQAPGEEQPKPERAGLIPDSGFRIPDSLQKPMSGKPDDAPPDPDSPQGLLAHLNRQAGSRFRPVKANLDLLRARLKEATADEIRAVIDGRVRKWKGTDMAEYLRPATVFGAQKFAQYLGEASRPTAGGRPWYVEAGYGDEHSARAAGKQPAEAV